MLAILRFFIGLFKMGFFITISPYLGRNSGLPRSGTAHSPSSSSYLYFDIVKILHDLRIAHGNQLNALDCTPRFANFRTVALRLILGLQRPQIFAGRIADGAHMKCYGKLGLSRQVYREVFFPSLQDDLNPLGPTFSLRLVSASMPRYVA